jgi:hypothetical protein
MIENSQSCLVEGLARTIAAKEQEMKNLSEKIGKNASQQDLLQFQAKMNVYTQTLQMVTNVQAEHAKALKSVIDNIR